DRGRPIDRIVIHRFEAAHARPEPIIAQARVRQFLNVKARTAFRGADTLLGAPIRRLGDPYHIGLRVGGTHEQEHEPQPPSHARDPRTDTEVPVVGGCSVPGGSPWSCCERAPVCDAWPWTSRDNVWLWCASTFSSSYEVRGGITDAAKRLLGQFCPSEPIVPP